MSGSRRFCSDLVVVFGFWVTDAVADCRCLNASVGPIRLLENVPTNVTVWIFISDFHGDRCHYCTRNERNDGETRDAEGGREGGREGIYSLLLLQAGLIFSFRRRTQTQLRSNLREILKAASILEKQSDPGWPLSFCLFFCFPSFFCLFLSLYTILSSPSNLFILTLTRALILTLT